MNSSALTARGTSVRAPSFSDSFDAPAPDAYDRLCAPASLAPREALVLRAYAAYLRQLGQPFGDELVAGALARQPEVTRALLELFRARFDPARPGATVAASRLDATLAAVARDEDLRVLNLLRGLVQATLRTNFYVRDGGGAPRPALAFKFDGRAVEGSPKPAPLYEIFVHSDRLEGVHLRGGKVARGGLRWSDRHADYRTEVHGL
jgi:glutamate dehydrogenase